MGAKLTEFYAVVAKEFGVPGRMKFAMLTKISSEKAAAEADTPDNIKLFENALVQLRSAA
jgi:hypothetical protein